jgi:hypothetical protein
MCLVRATLLRALGQAQELEAELIVIIDDLERSDVAPFCIAVHSSPVRILSHVPSCTELHFFSVLRCAARNPPPHRAKNGLGGDPGLRQQGRISSLAYPALTPSARKRASGRAGITCGRA